MNTAKRVIINGPMGMFEEGRFSNGTYLIMKQLSEIKAKTIVGGGDTAAAVNKLGFEKEILSCFYWWWCNYEISRRW